MADTFAQEGRGLALLKKGKKKTDGIYVDHLKGREEATFKRVKALGGGKEGKGRT